MESVASEAPLVNEDGDRPSFGDQETFEGTMVAIGLRGCGLRFYDFAGHPLGCEAAACASTTSLATLWLSTWNQHGRSLEQ